MHEIGSDVAGMQPGPTILIAENESDHRFVLKRVFRTVGLDVRLRFVNDGEEMLDYLERSGASADAELFPWPDIVLIDLHMPRRDGISTLQEIRSRETLRTVPAIIFSSSDQPHHIDRAYASGANAYLVKVGDFEQLVTHLQGMVAFWLHVARLPRPPGRPVPEGLLRSEAARDVQSEAVHPDAVDE